MSNPVWKTQPGNLGTIEERVFYKLELEADNSSQFELISGNLPSGLQLKANGVIDGVPSVRNILQGVPFDVGENVTSKFVIRARGNVSVADRTFELTVTGQDKPAITTPAGSLGEFIEGDYVEIQLEAEDLDLDELTWAVANFELPPGLSLDPTSGVISGYIQPQPAEPDARVGYDANNFDLYVFDVGTKSVDKNYLFAISVSDGKDIVQKNYTIFVYSRNNLTADNTIYTADDQGVLTADQDTARNPILRYDSVNLGSTFHDDYFAVQFLAEDFDNDEIEFVLDTSDAGESVPAGLVLDSETGWLYGHIGFQSASEIDYTFSIQVRKKQYPTYASDLATFMLTVLGDAYRDITWSTPSNLGVIRTGEISTLYVEAVDENGNELKYSLDNYQKLALPQGLKFNSDGTITGRVNFNIFTLDKGTTTFDQNNNNYNETTFDRKYEFEVTAQDASGLIFSTKIFTVTVDTDNVEPYENLYVGAFLSLEKRRKYKDFVSTIDIFKPADLYRRDDFYFGVQQDIRMLMLPGVNAKTASQFISAMNQHHYNKKLRFGGVKTARALDARGNVKYEVVYVDIVDNINGISKQQQLEKASASYTGIDTVYPNSLNNMIAQIRNQIGVSYADSYPEWMTSKQQDGSVLNWIPAVVLAYTKPGKSAQVAYNIENNSNFVFKDLDFTIDRYLWDSDLSENFDKNTREYIDSAETTFDINNNRQQFIGDGSTRRFTLQGTITNPENVLVVLNVKDPNYDSAGYDSVTFDLTQDAVSSNEYQVIGNDVVFATAPEAGTTILIEDTKYSSDIFETTFDNRNTRFITGSIVFRNKDYGDKYLKFPHNGVLEHNG